MLTFGYISIHYYTLFIATSISLPVILFAHRLNRIIVIIFLSLYGDFYYHCYTFMLLYFNAYFFCVPVFTVKCKPLYAPTTSDCGLKMINIWMCSCSLLPTFHSFLYIYCDFWKCVFALFALLRAVRLVLLTGSPTSCPPHSCHLAVVRWDQRGPPQHKWKRP